MLVSAFARALDSAIASAGTEDSTASTDSALASRVQRESAGGAEAIEHATARVALGGQVVLALVEIDAGLLAVQQVGFELQAVHLDRDALGNFARQNQRLGRQAFQLAHAGIVARQNAGGMQKFVQAMRDDVARAIHALAQRLHHQVRAVAIDDQPGQKICFGKD